MLESANTPTDSFALEKGKELAIDTGIAITGTAAIKGLGVAGSKVLESSSAQKVKSVLFKGEKGTNVATKTTTAKLTTNPDSGALYDSEPSTRIGISAIDGKKDRRAHEVLGGYGENISTKDFKLQVQAEKALDAHAKKTASGAGKSSKTSKVEVSGIGKDKTPKVTEGLKIVRNNKDRVKGVEHTQNHHILHQKLREHPLWKEAGMDVEDSLNKMLLPTKKGASLSTTERSIHEGRHFKSIERGLRTKMNEILDLGKTQNYTKEQYQEALKELINHERGGLYRGETALNKNARPWATK